jgi:hypothetical protein
VTLPLPALSLPRADPETLAARLLDGPTATAALEAWCVARGLGAGPLRIARLDGAPCPSLADAARAAFAPDAARWRRVAILRGALALSEAEIWWAPARLTDDMAAALDATDAPFGAVVAPLGPRRETLGLTLDPLALPRDVALDLRARLVDRSGRVIALTREAYAAALLG